MSFVMQEIVDKARVPLNDSEKTRYSDDVLLSYANDALLLLRNKRPDLFIGSYSALPEKLVIDATFPITSEHMPPVMDYVVARAESHNDESVLTERAALFFKLAEGQI